MNWGELKKEAEKLGVPDSANIVLEEGPFAYAESADLINDPDEKGGPEFIISGFSLTKK